MIFRSFTLISPLPRAECRSRLAIRTQDEDRLGGTRPLVGSITEHALTVQQNVNFGNAPGYIRNSFQATLKGKLRDYNGGTIVYCRIGPHPTLIYVFIAFTAACVLQSGYNLVDYLMATGPSKPDPRPIFGGLLLPVILGGIGLLAY